MFEEEISLTSGAGLSAVVARTEAEEERQTVDASSSVSTRVAQALVHVYNTDEYGLSKAVLTRITERCISFIFLFLNGFPLLFGFRVTISGLIFNKSKRSVKSIATNNEALSRTGKYLHCQVRSIYHM